MSTSHRTILFLICFTTAAHAGAQGVPDLKTVIERAQGYVTAANRRYNIGDFIRIVNVPTFPLTILHSSNVGRFVFEKGAQKKIGTTTAWEIRFSEASHPTIIRDLNDNDQAQHGSLWMDPDTGTILKTETRINTRTVRVWGKVTLKVTLIVTYKLSAKLNMLVPDTMEERYDSEFHRVDATATYSNFRRFETEVKLEDIGPVEQ